jgi:hypothetical protein
MEGHLRSLRLAKAVILWSKSALALEQVRSGASGPELLASLDRPVDLLDDQPVESDARRGNNY